MQTVNLISRTENLRREFNSLVSKYKIDRNLYYPSSHFFERCIERGFENKLQDIFYSFLLGLKYFKNTTYSNKSLKHTNSGLCVIMDIKINPISKRRVLVLNTIYEIDNENVYFDEEIF